MFLAVIAFTLLVSAYGYGSGHGGEGGSGSSSDCGSSGDCHGPGTFEKGCLDYRGQSEILNNFHRFLDVANSIRNSELYSTESPGCDGGGPSLAFVFSFSSLLPHPFF